MNAKITANELKNMGFEAKVYGNRVFVSLQNRRVCSHEVVTAMEQAALPEMQVKRHSYGVLVTVS